MHKKHRAKTTPALTQRVGHHPLRWLTLAGCMLFLSASGLATQALAETSPTDPIGWVWYHGVSAEFISEQIVTRNACIIDLEIEDTVPYRFSVVMVNNGCAQWWWYYGLTINDLVNKVNLHQARILDLEAYQVNGQQRFAAVLLPNTGPKGKAWWFYYNVTPDFIAERISATGGRIIDLDTYFVGATRLYSVVLIANQGIDAKAWWYYYNVTPDFIAEKLGANQARLVDIEPHSSGTFTVVMEKSLGEYWWWYYGLSANSINALATQHGARIIDIEPYYVNGEKRFGAIMLDNK